MKLNGIMCPRSLPTGRNIWLRFTNCLYFKFDPRIENYHACFWNWPYIIPKTCARNEIKEKTYFRIIYKEMKVFKTTIWVQRLQRGYDVSVLFKTKTKGKTVHLIWLPISQSPVLHKTWLPTFYYPFSIPCLQLIVLFLNDWTLPCYEITHCKPHVHESHENTMKMSRIDFYDPQNLYFEIQGFC